VLPDTDAPTATYRRAAERKDVPGMLACLAPDAVLKSPITDGFDFRGLEQLAPLFEDVFAVVDDVRYTADVGDDRTRMLRLEARVGRQRLDEAMLVQLAPDGRITHMELFIRPMPGLTALAAALGPRVAGRRSRARALAVRAMIAPLAFATRHGEGLGSRLARP
jgi:hypothetical protein